MSKTLFKTAVLIVLLASMTITISSCQAPQTGSIHSNTDTIVGVSRWDGQVGDSSPVGKEENRILGSSKWNDRLPFYATKPTSDTVSMSCTTQEIMDREIAYAKEAGIDYWAFCWYSDKFKGDCSDMAIPRKLYLSSTHKDDIKWCAILFTHTMYEDEEDAFVKQMGEPNYQKVLNGRPLIYCFKYPIATKEQIDRLREKCKAAGIPDPYIVVTGPYEIDGLYNFAEDIKADAVSFYAFIPSDKDSYSLQSKLERGTWKLYKKDGKKVIPCVTLGWDVRPRVEAEPDYKYSSNQYGYYLPEPTTDEISSQLQSAIDWNNANKDAAEANTLLMYSWNEFSECGVRTVCPKMNGDRSVLDAIKKVLVK